MSGCYMRVLCAALASWVLTGAPAPAATEQVIHSFQIADGVRPYRTATNIDGTLYGTTYLGGGYGFGTVYAVTPTGTLTVLHSFTGGNDGSYSVSTLFDFHGKLYGTASGGGAYYSGVVFALSKATAAFTVVYSFKGGSDGNEPSGSLSALGGKLYGTTYGGGPYSCYDNPGCGTAFSVTPAGTEKVLHAFGGSGDGAEPFSRLTYANGTFYGTTFFGGTHGGGAVFAMTPTGAETIVHSFEGNSDGWNTESDLIDVGGTLYGTTLNGGSGGKGTVFSISPAGQETVLYAFKGGADGATPDSALVEINGTLYGTTYQGGSFVGNYCNNMGGCGTVFSITPSGVKKTLYAFQGQGQGGGTDGAGPNGVTKLGGTLYGTTDYGGTADWGTVFSVKP